MRRNLVIAGAVFALGALAGASVVSLAAPELNLRGDRFRPLKYEELNPAQKALADRDLAAPSRSGGGPLNIFLRSPEYAELARPLSNYLRFKSPFPEKLKELTIMLTARAWGGTYVWYSHRPFAIKAGLSEALDERFHETCQLGFVCGPTYPTRLRTGYDSNFGNARLVQAMVRGERPASMDADEVITYDFVTELLQTRQVSDAAYKKFVDRFGERDVVDLVALMGAYHTTSMLFRVERYPLPPGVKEEIAKPM